MASSSEANGLGVEKEKKSVQEDTREKLLRTHLRAVTSYRWRGLWHRTLSRLRVLNLQVKQATRTRRRARMLPGSETTEPFWVLMAKRQLQATTAWRSQFQAHQSHAHTEAGTRTAIILNVAKCFLQDNSLTELLRAAAWCHTGHVDIPRR